jgi:hypothetical protein
MVLIVNGRHNKPERFLQPTPGASMIQLVSRKLTSDGFDRQVKKCYSSSNYVRMKLSDRPGTTESPQLVVVALLDFTSDHQFPQSDRRVRHRSDLSPAQTSGSSSSIRYLSPDGRSRMPGVATPGCTTAMPRCRDDVIHRHSFSGRQELRGPTYRSPG